jgi:ketosteroid isomerase-like protein
VEFTWELIMRSIRLAALLSTTILFAACGGEEPAPQAPPPPVAPSATASVAVAPPPADTATPPPPPKPSLAELMEQTLKGLGEAFNAHDAKKIASFHTEDCVVLGYGEPDAHGREDVQKSVQRLFDTFGDAKSAATRVWVKGNVAISELVWSATMTGDFMGMKATKKPVGQARVHVAWFSDDGLLKEVHQYADGAGLMAQIEGKPGAPTVPLLPTNAADVHIAKGTPEEDKLADWGKGIAETFSKADLKAAVALMADDGDDWINISRMPPTKGKKEMTKGIDAWFKAVPDQKWTVSNAWGVDGFAIVESTLTGTQKGRLGSLPPSSKPITGWHWLDISQSSADGKVLHHWGYANLIEMMEQTGALKHAGAKTGGPMDAAGAKASAAPAPKPAPAASKP